MASGVGLIPEQAWEVADLARSPFGTDPTVASIGFQQRQGRRLRSRADLVGGAVRPAAADLARRPIVERRRTPTDRYVTHTARARRRSTSPRRRTASRRLDPVTVTGTTAPGNTIDVSAVDRRTTTRRSPASTTAGADGASASTSPLSGGTRVLNIVATDAGRRAPRARQRTIVFDFVPGTLLFDVDDPDGDDNGPGNYAYPTSGDFQPGAYDLQRFQVYDAGDRISSGCRPAT